MKWLFSRQELFSRRDARQGSVSQKKQADMRSTKGTCKQNKSLNIYNYRLLTPTCFETLWFKEAMALFATRFFAPCTFDPSPACYRHRQFLFFLLDATRYHLGKGRTRRKGAEILCFNEHALEKGQKKWGKFEKVEADGTWFGNVFLWPKTFGSTPF